MRCVSFLSTCFLVSATGYNFDWPGVGWGFEDVQQQDPPPGPYWPHGGYVNLSLFNVTGRAWSISTEHSAWCSTTSCRNPPEGNRYLALQNINGVSESAVAQHVYNMAILSNGFNVSFYVMKRPSSDANLRVTLNELTLYDSQCAQTSWHPISLHVSAETVASLGSLLTLKFTNTEVCNDCSVQIDDVQLTLIPQPPPTTLYIRGSRSQLVFGTNDECTLELASGAALTSTCPINTPSSRRLEDTSNDSDRITQLETRIAQLEMDKAEMKEQLQFLTTEFKMLKEQRKSP